MKRGKKSTSSVLVSASPCTSQIPSAKPSSPWPIVNVSMLSALAVASHCPQPHEHTLCNLNLIFTLFGIPRTTLFGRNLLPRELLIWTVLYRSLTSFGMKKYFSIPHLWCCGSIHRIPFPIETLCFTLSDSCVNSSVSLIWDFCHLLSFPQASKKLSQCSVTLRLWIVNDNHEIASHGSLLWPLLKSSDHCTIKPKTFDTENMRVREQRKTSTQI